jgi:hypothetical protein
MKRERATELLEDLLRQARSTAWPAALVQAVYVFGSYQRGALQPGGLDVAVDIDVRDERWLAHYGYCTSYGYSPYSILRHALRGRTRSVAIIFERQALRPDVHLTLIWRRGETLEQALDRVHAIPIDPTAGHAPRGAMLPCFEGVEDTVPLFVREELITMINHGAVTVTQVTLPDRQITDDELPDPAMRRRIERRWSATSPLRRAALTTLAYLREQAIDLDTVDLHGLVLGQALPRFYVDFELRYLAYALERLEGHGATHWLEVLHPARRGPMPALDIAVRDRAKLIGRPETGILFFRKLPPPTSRSDGPPSPQAG